MIFWTAVLLSLLTVTLFVRAALSTFSWSRLESAATNRPAQLSKIFQSHEDVSAGWRVVFWMLVAILVALVSASEINLLETTFVLLWLGFIAFELFVTRPLAGAVAEPFLLNSWPALAFVARIGMPFVWLEQLCQRVADRIVGREQAGSAIEEEILSVVNEGRREGAIRSETEEMLEGLFELHSIRVSEIMTPRTEMISLKVTDTIEDARKLICEQQHSRIPVRGENREEIIGVLYAKDLLPHLGDRNRSDAPIGSLALRQPAFVPESKPVDVLLQDFRRARMHMAIVFDEYSGVAGLVTMEDILEEIVGEIADEYDEQEVSPIVQVQDSIWEAQGKVHLSELNEKLSLSLPEDAEFDTLAGYVFHTLGRPPIVGDVFSNGDIHFQVMSVKKRMADRVRIEGPATVAEEGDKAEKESESLADS